MIIHENIQLKDKHTFHIPAIAKWFVEYDSVEELKELLASEWIKDKRFLHIGSGSNLLFLGNYDGAILHSRIKTITIKDETERCVKIKVGSGVIWDDFVAYCIDRGWYGTENLSKIPGEVGASAVQNIGAYGSEVKDIIDTVETIEIESGEHHVFNCIDCKYGYRNSIFKNELKEKHIVTFVTYCLSKQPIYNLSYGNLKTAVETKGTINLRNIRNAVIEIRENKLPDPEITGNAGSFFMNPVIPLFQYSLLKEKYPDIPHYPIDNEKVKVPAAWLIDRCGWKGKIHGGAAVHDKQCLVLINKNNATSDDVVELSEEIKQSVKSNFNITITPEVNFIR
ncbi:UDP-N-acetylmuramate dehydrogenase [Coprobacter tertius]|uniref:UDP-N-acetylenolpyruvoylglucosamine reductase n=1 Tax=Coprobacter tertius TaxID=2944915 RepID=A0ABT1MLD9_9BACT|nr:UDP-N-acetylmuramate dehydrogenase [Coprobacter tertius]MCP9612081.1 UDP-N-acetylmuramate dehydrogenase [Coprobacter tertius]